MKIWIENDEGDFFIHFYEPSPTEFGWESHARAQMHFYWRLIIKDGLPNIPGELREIHLKLGDLWEANVEDEN